MQEKIIEEQGELSGKDKREHPGVKVCKHCSIKFDITDKDLEFYEKLSPSFGGKKYSIPTPTFCPDCRQQRRISFKNDRKLYRRTCDLTGKSILSLYSPDKPYKVYEQKEWWSDKWNALDYGKSFDFSKSFFSQFKELSFQVPIQSLSNINCENCDYGHGLINSKNSYLCFGNTEIEETLYSMESFKIKSSMDILWSGSIENSYEIHNGGSLSSCYFCSSSNTSHKIYFCKECNNCKNCLFCFGLFNQEYCIFNEKYSPEEYEKKLKQFLNMPNFIEYGKKVSSEFFLKKPHKYESSYNANNSFGDYLYNSLNIYNSFIVTELKDSRYCYECGRANDLIDASFVYDCEGKIIESLDLYNSFNVLFSANISSSSDILYSNNLLNCHNCFGCIGLTNQDYCILNKKYSKEEYEVIVQKIVEHMKKTQEWGEFLNPDISYFGYNETVANDYYVLDKENALKSGFKWSDYEPPFPKVEKIIKASMLPNEISKIPDDILNWAVECEISGKPFRIVKAELDFYRKHNLPIPKRHPDQRHLDRLALRNPRKLWERMCDKCGKEIKTTYSPDRKEIVYCEECYLEII